MKYVRITWKSDNTSWVEGRGIVGLLDQLGLPRQYDREARKWMTSRRAGHTLEAFANVRGWRVLVNDQRTLDGAAS